MCAHCHSNGFVCRFGKSLQKVISVYIQATTGKKARRSECVIAMKRERKWDGASKPERDWERVRGSKKQTSKANKMDEREKEWLASYTTRRSFYFQLSVFHRKAAVEMLKENEFEREKSVSVPNLGQKVAKYCWQFSMAIIRYRKHRKLFIWRERNVTNCYKCFLSFIIQRKREKNTSSETTAF